MLSKDEIKDFFLLENSHAKKELGQNFLIDENAIKKIVESINIKENDKVLEIGPGLGALSDELVNISNDLTLVEYDQKFVNFLISSYRDKNNVKIIKSNILHFKDYSFNKIIGNLPYYISTEILEYLFKHFDKINQMVFMVQSEFLNRILANKGKDYAPLNILINYRYNIEKLFIVKKTSFFPIPNVDSVVFKITIKDNTSFAYSLLLYKVANILFKNRRKTIYNNLKPLFKDTDELELFLNELNLKENLRAEELDLSTYLKITDKLLENKKISLE